MRKIAVLKFFLLIYSKHLSIYFNCSDKKYMKTIYNIILYLKFNFSMYLFIGNWVLTILNNIIFTLM